MATSSIQIQLEGLDINPDVPYSLEKDYTGHAVIVDNENTEGTQADVAALRQAYEAAGFEVQVHRECSGQKMRQIARFMKNESNHVGCNMFLLTVICHGNKEGKLMDTDGNPTWDTEELAKEISELDSLKGKPKIFFIQASRGDEWNTASDRALSTDEPRENPLTIPIGADIFIGYATVPGFRAAAGGEEGSVFLQAVAKYLREEYRTRTLQDIFLMVKQAVIKINQGRTQKVQVSQETSSLTKHVRFR